MAGFTVVSENFNVGWFPVNYNTETLYVGQFVTLDSTTPDYGVKAWNIAGANDTTVDQSVLGIVVGFNNRTPTFNTTYKGDYATSVSTQAAQLARDWVLAEGMTSKGDPALYAQVAIVDCTTIIRGRVFDSAYGTAPDVITNTTASTDGSTIVSAATDHAGLAGGTTWYCRTGANMGLYRLGYDTSTTSHTFYLTWPYDIAVGDTFVPVHAALGTCKLMFDSVGTYVEQWGDNNSFGTNYIYARVLNMNLRDSGAEYITFQLTPNNFFPVSRT